MGDGLFNMEVLAHLKRILSFDKPGYLSLRCDLGGSGPAKSFPKIFIKQQLVMLFTNSPHKKPVGMIIIYIYIWDCDEET